MIYISITYLLIFLLFILSIYIIFITSNKILYM